MRYNRSMIETPLPLAPDLWMIVPAAEPAPLLAQLATLRLENATLVVLANKSGLFGGGAAGPIFFDIARLLFPERFPQPAANARAVSPAPLALAAYRDLETLDFAAASATMR